MYGYHYHNTKHVGAQQGIENINNNVYFEETALPVCFASQWQL
jgi:hypothetical protein